MLREIRLNSNWKFLAPYAMRKFMAYYKDENEAGKKEWVGIVQRMWGIPAAMAADLLSGRISWWVSGMTVAFDVDIESYGGWAND